MYLAKLVNFGHDLVLTGAACHGLDKFHFSVASPSTGKVLVMETSCI